MIPAITAGDVHDLCFGFLVAVVAPIDMNARRVEMDNAGRHELVGGLMVKESGDQVERLMDTPQAIEHHGFDGYTHGEIAHVRVLLGCLIDALAHAECVEHASDKAEVVYDLATVRGLIRHHHLL